ncbi:MAG: aspartate kinase [Nitrososphaerota archaeon]|nr:aspartate kinase [Candidatus Bathyarchaeota archaeon]MDW8022282.1 aspartate kinase [Nitrososphaerota archaeon]
MEAATKRVVVKFGGGELTSGKAYREAAKMVKESGFKEIVVVVSAMKGVTDNLIKCIAEAGEAEDADYSDVVAMGERISARIFCSALKSLGVRAAYFDPQQERWPIITDSNFKDATPDVNETRRRVKKYLEPLLRDCVPVVCGFIGKDKNGRITTLGRGGSDITATLLGNCLKADEVILVKNTSGVLSADPKIVPDAKPLDRITIEEMFSLAQGGAKIIHPEALKYKLPRQKLRVVMFQDSLSSGGTEIVGVFKANPIEIRKHYGLSAITLVGEVSPSNLNKVFPVFDGRKIFGMGTSRNSITIFVDSKNPMRVVNQICRLNYFKAVSLRENVAAIELVSPNFIDSPGWVAKASGALAEKRINILEVITNKASITIFVDKDKMEEALTAIKTKLGENIGLEKHD